MNNLKDRCIAFFECELVWDKISHSYSSPGRHYHTLHHLRKMFDWLDRIEHVENRKSIELAIWFHDYIYETRSDLYPVNEQNSILAMVEICEQYCHHICYNDGSLIMNASNLIACTKTHDILVDKSDAMWLTTAYFLDIDLSILGETAAFVQIFEQNIRSEFIQYTDSDFVNGRLAALLKFKQRNTVYFTDFFKKHLEDAAQHNLKYVIQDLTTRQKNYELV